MVATPGRLVIHEAPAGCGKTYSAVRLALDATPTRVLMLSHTNVARQAFQQQGRATGDDLNHVSLRTFDGFACEVATAYHTALGLSADVAEDAVKTRNGLSFLRVAELVGTLLSECRTLADFLAKRFPVIVCDEHQDTNGFQWRIVDALRQCGATVHAFGDPMQEIFTFHRGRAQDRLTRAPVWSACVAAASDVRHYAIPYRWRDAPALGDWIQEQRERLVAGRPIAVKPTSFVQVVRVEVTRPDHQKDSFKLDADAHREIRAWVRRNAKCLLLTRYSNGVAAIEAAYRHEGVRVHEGTDRECLHAFAEAASLAVSVEERAAALCAFLCGTTVGFTGTYRKALLKAATGCYKPTSEWGRTVVSAADALRRREGFQGAVDAMIVLVRGRLPNMRCVRNDELNDAAFAARVTSVGDGVAAARMRRARMSDSRPRARSSTIHSAKGLEADAVAILPCDRKEFPDTDDGRKLMYVALSRATKKLLLAIPHRDCSHLIET